jgi:hypothetical protein
MLSAPPQTTRSLTAYRTYATGPKPESTTSNETGVERLPSGCKTLSAYDNGTGIWPAHLWSHHRRRNRTIPELTSVRTLMCPDPRYRALQYCLTLLLHPRQKPSWISTLLSYEEHPPVMHRKSLGKRKLKRPSTCC